MFDQILMALLLFSSVAHASVILPYSFTASGSIRASEANADFGALRDEINNHESTANAHNTTLSDILTTNNSCGLNNLDFNLNQGLNMRVENLSSDPVCASGSKGRLIFNTVSGLFKVCDGTSYVSIAGTGVNNLDSVLNAGNSAGAHNLDMNGNQLLNARVENLGSDPSPSIAGRLFYNTVAGALKLDTGSVITAIGGSQSLSSVLTTGNSAGATNINFNGNQALNMRWEQLASDPGTTTSGRVYYNTSSNQPKFYNGSSWLTVGNTNTLAQTMALGNSVGSTDLDLNSRQAKNMRLHNIAAPPGTGTAGMIWYDTLSDQIQYETVGANKTVATLDDSQTLTNKTISGSSNTISNVQDSALSSNVMLKTANETIIGTKTFSTSPVVSSLKTASGGTHTLTDGLANDTFTLNNAVQELKGKTLNAPTLSGNIDFAGFQGIKLRAENLASNPSSGSPGRLFYKTSTGELLFDDGTKWNALSFTTNTIPTLAQVLGSGNSAAAIDIDVNQNQLLNARVENVTSLPAPGSAGRLVYDTTNSTFYVDSGSAWIVSGTTTFPSQYVTVTVSSAVAVNTPYVVANCASACTISLPAVTSVVNGANTYLFYVKSIGAGAVTVQGIGGDLIDGAATAALNFQYAALTLLPTSGGWLIQ